MNASSPEPIIERPWLTYTKALVFILPAVVAWGFACVFLVPKAKEVCDKAGFDPSQLGWLWPATFFLVEWSRTILVAVAVALVLVEVLARRGWPRRLVMGIGIWMANVLVLFGLSILLMAVLAAAPGLAHPR